MRYEVEVKSARMAVTGREIDGGFIRIYAAQEGQILCDVSLPSPCGAVVDDALILLCDPPLKGVGVGKGKAMRAEIFGRDKRLRITDLSVGDMGSTADIRLDNAEIGVGQEVEITSAIFQHA
jgi:hypothetical protein